MGVLHIILKVSHPNGASNIIEKKEFMQGHRKGSPPPIKEMSINFSQNLIELYNNYLLYCIKHWYF